MAGEGVNPMGVPCHDLTAAARVAGLALPDDVVHAFTGRGAPQGGPFAGREGSLAVAAFAGDPAAEADRQRAAWADVLDRLGVAGVALVDQVHGAEVIEVSAPSGPLATAGEADAVITAVPGVAVAVRVADCVPLLLTGAGAVGAVHCGWRGVAAGLAPKAVAALRALLRREGGGEAIVGLVGPHIQAPAFEVGPEVVDGIVATGVAAARFAVRGRGDRWHVDLGEALRAQLEEVGVPTVHHGGCATSESFFSWRADGPTTGRQAGVIARLPL